jgi:glycosyltransferase involved in cell wall biosynthesis
LRLLQLIDSLQAGGAERMAVNMANLFARKGHESTLVVSRKSGKLAGFVDTQVNLVILSKRSSLDQAAFRRLIKTVNKLKPDIIHAHATSIYWATLINLFLSKNIPVIWHDHYGDSENLTDRNLFPLRYFANQINGVVAVNEKLKNWAISQLRISDNRVVYLRNFGMLDSTKAQKNSVFTIIQVANLRPQKDHSTALKAFELLKKEGRDFQVYWAGNLEDKEHVSMLLEKIKDLNLEENIHVLGEVEDVNSYLNRSHLGLLSSKSEGLPVALLEYGMAKLPVVCTAVGQCEEVISESSLGILTQPGNYSQLAESLAKLMDDTSLSRELGENLFFKINQTYGPDSFYRDYMDFIHNFVQEASKNT